jgi:hypothetical protein
MNIKVQIDNRFSVRPSGTPSDTSFLKRGSWNTSLNLARATPSDPALGGASKNFSKRFDNPRFSEA